MDVCRGEVDRAEGGAVVRLRQAGNKGIIVHFSMGEVGSGLGVVVPCRVAVEAV